MQILFKQSFHVLFNLFVSLQIWHLIYTLHHVEMCKIKTKIYKYEIFGKHKIMETLASAAINSLRIYLTWDHAFRQQVTCPLLKVYILWWLPIMCISKIFNINSICLCWDYQVNYSRRNIIKIATLFKYLYTLKSWFKNHHINLHTYKFLIYHSKLILYMIFHVEKWLI